MADYAHPESLVTTDWVCRLFTGASEAGQQRVEYYDHPDDNHQVHETVAKPPVVTHVHP